MELESLAGKVSGVVSRAKEGRGRLRKRLLTFQPDGTGSSQATSSCLLLPAAKFNSYSMLDISADNTGMAKCLPGFRMEMIFIGFKWF